ncbi:hypothetical protein BDY21DRAFT_368951 [Lineolata rhizophorae]|uniref:Uncharacterized protein n=1 Tax=Lineolata rhizophorae TaxID=578093 RepID=A0A6A6PAA3_9PEZI|nr:hypothetical protein BDY21DRAFT_368951 [Lineolata rhizophorae]
MVATRLRDYPLPNKERKERKPRRNAMSAPAFGVTGHSLSTTEGSAVPSFDGATLWTQADNMDRTTRVETPDSLLDADGDNESSFGEVPQHEDDAAATQAAGVLPEHLTALAASQTSAAVDHAMNSAPEPVDETSLVEADQAMASTLEPEASGLSQAEATMTSFSALESEPNIDDQTQRTEDSTQPSQAGVGAACDKPSRAFTAVNKPYAEMPSEAPTDSHGGSEAVATTSGTPTGDREAAGKGTDYEFHPTISRNTPLSLLGEEGSPTGRDARQHSDAEGDDEPITEPSGDGVAVAPSAILSEGVKATTQDLALATGREASSDTQDEAMCAQQLAHADTSESPPDPPAKAKAAVAQDAVKPRSDDGPGIYADEVEGGSDAGSPPVILPDVDDISQAKAVQVGHVVCAALLFRILNGAEQGQGSNPTSKNGESIADCDPTIDKPLAAVPYNDDCVEDAQDNRRSEIGDPADEATTVWPTGQTGGPSDQGNPEGSSQDDRIIVDDAMSDTDVTDIEEDGAATSNQSGSTQRKRKLEDTVAWGDPKFEEETASQLDST